LSQLKLRRGVLLLSLLVSLALLTGAAADTSQVTANHQIADYDRNAVPYCYDYGCRSRSAIDISDADWSRILILFHPAPATAEAERQAISWAVGIYEEIAGRQTPSWRDRGKNPIDAEPPGQLDCVDESTNTDHFLRLLAQQGMLRQHKVVDIAHRLGFIDQHYSAQVEELDSGQRYVVDSWFLDNGQPAFIQTIEEWEAVTSLFGFFNRSRSSSTN
jgi:hypothetical protein